MAWIGQFGYKEDDIVMLTDDQNDPRAIPTKENIVSSSSGLCSLIPAIATIFLLYTPPLHVLTELFTFVDIVSRDAVARERRAAERFVVFPLYVRRPLLFQHSLFSLHLLSPSLPLMDPLNCVDRTCTDGLVRIVFLGLRNITRVDSGHGGQTKDLDGDEADGYDEGALFAAASAFLLHICLPVLHTASC